MYKYTLYILRKSDCILPTVPQSQQFLASYLHDSILGVCHSRPAPAVELSFQVWEDYASYFTPKILSHVKRSCKPSHQHIGHEVRETHQKQDVYHLQSGHCPFQDRRSPVYSAFTSRLLCSWRDGVNSRRKLFISIFICWVFRRGSN